MLNAGARGVDSVVSTAAKHGAVTRVLEAEPAPEIEARRRSGSQCSTSEPSGADEVVRALSQALRETPGRLYREPGCVSNALESPKFSKEPAAPEPSKQQVSSTLCMGASSPFATTLGSLESAGSESRIESKNISIVLVPAELEGWVQAEAGSEPQGRRKRGRPAGLQPWNKGHSMPQATKAKISMAQKARWRDPSLGLQAVQSERQKVQLLPSPHGLALFAEIRM